jgi:hypothetical protein
MIRRNTDKKISRLLDEVRSKITLGYTHDNFVDISYLLKDLEPVLERNEILFLEAAWRDSYTDSCNEKTLDREIGKIKTRFC